MSLNSELEQPLFFSENKKIYASDFVEALQKSGVKEGDTLLVHSDISVFGKLCTFDRNAILEALINVLKTSVGNTGTIVMPTFSYSFCNGEVYDVQSTPSTVGTLTEYFRKQPDVKRTAHPIFSFAVWGKHTHKILDIKKDSFDENSVFGKIPQLGGKLVFLGTTFHSCTYLHHIEQMHGIPYRFLKTFHGRIINNSLEYEDECTFFVRYLDRNVILDTTKFEEYLLGMDLMKKIPLGTGKILVTDAKVLLYEGCKKLDEDIYFLLKEEPKIQ